MATQEEIDKRFREAAHNADIDELMEAARLGADINGADDIGNNALHLACLEGSLDTVHILMKMGVESMVANGQDMMARDIARAQDFDEIVEYLDNCHDHTAVETFQRRYLDPEVAVSACAGLRAGNGVDAITPDGETILHMAAQYNRLDLIEAALAGGAIIEASNDNLETPLHWACAANQSEVAEKLLDAGADIDARDKYDYTPLHLACIQEAVETIHMLIDAGADPEIPGKAGRRALHWACAAFNADAVEALVTKGVGVEQADNMGWTPMELALDFVSDGSLSVAGDGQFVRILKAFMGAGVDPYRRGALGMNVFEVVQANRNAHNSRAFVNAWRKQREMDVHSVAPGAAPGL